MRFMFNLFFFVSSLGFSQANYNDSTCFFVPNVITCDCDQIPCEQFRAFAICDISEFEMNIYTKSGEHLFQSNDLTDYFTPSDFDLKDQELIWVIDCTVNTDEDEIQAQYAGTTVYLK